MANFRLGENQKALDDLQIVIGKDPDAVAARQYRVIALARLGKKEEALADLEKFQKGDAPEHSKLYLAAVVAAELGEGADKAFEALEAALRKRPQDADLRYDAARAFALASKSHRPHGQGEGPSACRAQSSNLLREAVKNDDADFGQMDDDADLDPIRDDPAFAEIMKAGHPDRRYAAVWSTRCDRSRRSPIDGLDPADHLRTCRELIAQGYRPVVVVGRPDRARGTAGDGLGLAPPGGPGGGQGPAGRASGPGGGGPGSAGQGRGGLAPAAAQRRPPAAQLHRQLAEPAGCRSEADRRRTRPRSIPATPSRRRRPRATPEDGRHPLPPRDLERRALILALGTYGTDGTLPRRAGAADRQAARPLPQRPRRGHPRGGGMDPAAVEAAGEAQGRSMPS